jgi:hypothetical protein
MVLNGGFCCTTDTERAEGNRVEFQRKTAYGWGRIAHVAARVSQYSGRGASRPKLPSKTQEHLPGNFAVNSPEIFAARGTLAASLQPSSYRIGNTKLYFNTINQLHPKY